MQRWQMPESVGLREELIVITEGKVKVAVVQAAPWQFDKSRTVSKAIELIAPFETATFCTKPHARFRGKKW